MEANVVFVSETLVTDTRVYEIVRRSDRSLWLRPCVSGEIVKRDNTGRFGVVWNAAIPDPTGRVFRVGLRKDGTFRTGPGARALHPTRLINGTPVFRTDWDF